METAQQPSDTICMVHGRATVEILERPHLPAGGCHEIVGRDEFGNLWARYRVIGIVPHRGGYSYDIDGGCGGWTPRENVRNFCQERLDADRIAEGKASGALDVG